MGLNLTNRHFVKELDFTPQEWLGLVELTGRLKAARRDGREERQLLAGKTIALIFEKTSTRTRCAFEVAAYHLGAQLTFLDPHGSQMGHKESIADTARVLGRLYDGIEFRGSRTPTARPSPRMPGCRSTTASPTPGTRPRRCATS
jgi:ornithine carbamoyltransferase